MELPVQIEFRGVIYKRNPSSKDWSKRVYYQAPRGSGRSYLHRDVYAHEVGPIPEGMHVHHVDHNPFNNDPTNLTPITPKQHRREHGKKFDAERMQIFRDTTLAAAAKWHGSEQGRAWHREHGRNTWSSRAKDSFTCPECGVEHQGYFPARTGPSRYCSGRCRQRADKRAGKYLVAATCPICQAAFMRSTSTKQARTCSKSCGQKLRIAEGRTTARQSQRTLGRIPT